MKPILVGLFILLRVVTPRVHQSEMEHFNWITINISLAFLGGVRWRSWLRHCSITRKVAGSISDGVIAIFIDIALPAELWHWDGLSASNRNEYQEYLQGGKGGRCVGLTTLPPSSADCLEILGASTSWKPQGLYRPVLGLFYLSFFYPLS